MSQTTPCDCASKWQARWEEAVKAKEYALYEANEWKRKFLAEQDRRRELSKALLYFVKQDKQQTTPANTEAMIKKVTAMLSDTSDTTALLTPTLPSFDLDYDDDDESADEESGSFVAKPKGKQPFRRPVNLNLDNAVYESRPARSNTIDAGRSVHSPRSHKDFDHPHLLLRPFLTDKSLWHVSPHSRRLHDLVQGMTFFQTKRDRIFEHFLVAGLLSSTGLEPAASTTVHEDDAALASWKPKVLFQYPPSSVYPLNEQAVSSFCFPVGVPAFSCSAKDAARLKGCLVSQWTPDASSTIRQLLDPLHAQTYTFRLTGSKGEALYGFCAAVLMDIEEPAILLEKGSDDAATADSAADVRPATPAGKPSNSKFHSLAGILASPQTGATLDKDAFKSTITPRCYCFTSKYPLYKLHFQLLRLVLETDLKTRQQARHCHSVHTHEFEVTMVDAALGISFHEREDIGHYAQPRDRDHQVKLLNAIASPPPPSPSNSIVVTENTSADEISKPPTPATRHVRSRSWGGGADRSPVKRASLGKAPLTCAIVHTLTAAAAEAGIASGDILTAINGFPVDDMGFPDIMHLLETSKRPIHLRFKRLFHKNSTPVEPTTGPMYGSAVLDLLRRFRSMKVSEPGAWSTVKLPHADLKYQFPTGRTDDWTVGVLLRVMDAASIVQVLSCLLLEKQVAIVSESTAKLSVVNTALLALLRPFQWQSTFIPVLPSNLLDFLHSPVPFLVGVHPPLSTDEWPDVCFADLDAGTVECAQILAFPRMLELTRVLKDHSVQFAQVPSRPGQPWYEATEHESQLLTQILSRSESILASMCSDVTKLSLSPQADKTAYDVLQEEFVKTIELSEHRAFMTEFAQTQLFCQYCELVLDLVM
ncbi:hypothetical protein AeMF1_012780 [Aphanomyces euteiches]|nr:hypothetical protein AeMF1_012780 [Aphanomyces euteiches]KAH9190662.1 hypothetical protein AeNC1_007361 [Aphanomyces euteiches]